MYLRLLAMPSGVGLLIVYASYAVVMLRLDAPPRREVEHGLYFESIFRRKSASTRVAGQP